MSESPYDILGIAPGASKDEVKKAYRRKARENHPDLNPGDPLAAERMNKVNEAYDRLMNPEKYARQDRRRAAEQAARERASGQAAHGPFAGAGGSRSGGYRESSPGGGAYGWSSTDFTWDDLFGFGFAGAGAASPADIRPEASAHDAAPVRQAIADMNAGRHREAAWILAQVPSTGRDARWYYLSALANYGAGNEALGYEQILRAVRMEPDNGAYRRAYEAFMRPSQAYREQAQGQGFTVGMPGMECCCALVAFNACAGPCLAYGGLPLVCCV